MIYCLQQFRPYVLGHLTVIRSDHAALPFLKRTKVPIGQQARWLDFMEQFSLKLEYRRGPRMRTHMPSQDDLVKTLGALPTVF